MWNIIFGLHAILTGILVVTGKIEINLGILMILIILACYTYGKK